jgi:hypothetical protein
MKRYVFAAVVAFLAAAAVVGIAAAEPRPLADAGLDQEVGINTTVQLDGTGSTHPDGTIDGYEWSIETPAGARTTPACADCGRTSFRPTEPGRYNVTVVVTDSEGRSSTDTLYVYVRDLAPTVRLDGDTDPRTDEQTPYEAAVEANGSDLEELTWLIDGDAVATDSLSGSEATEKRSIGFSDSDTYRLAVVATDTTGRSDRDVLVVEPRTDREPQSDPDPGEVYDTRDETNRGDDIIFEPAFTRGVAESQPIEESVAGYEDGGLPGRGGAPNYRGNDDTSNEDGDTDTIYQSNSNTDRDDSSSRLSPDSIDKITRY